MNCFWQRCFCCKNFKKTKFIHIPNWWEVDTYYYHSECVHEVLCHPEKYSNYQISQAKKIVEEIKREKEDREEHIKSALKMCGEVENVL